LLLLAGEWEAGTGIIREALAELADRDVPSGRSSGVAVTRLQSWWAGLSAYDPSLVRELDHRMDELRSAARGSDVASRMLAGLLAGVLAWRGEREYRAAARSRARPRPLLARVDSDPLMAAQALFSPSCSSSKGGRRNCRPVAGSGHAPEPVVGLVIAACMHAAVGARRRLVSVETDVRTVIEIAAEYGMAFVIPSALVRSRCADRRPGPTSPSGRRRPLARTLPGPQAGRCFGVEAAHARHR
jgi:hypothetical protein